MISHAAHPPAIRRPAPRATAPIALSVGDTVVIGGQAYTVGVALIPAGGQPTPIPTPTPTPIPGPVVPTITGIRNLVTSQLVTSAVAGTSLRLEGANLGTDGRLQLAGRIVANPTSWNPNGVSFFAPDPGALTATGAWDLYWSVNGSWQLQASSGVFTLLPAPGPAPLPPGTPGGITGYRGPDGAVRTAAAVGDIVILVGTNFGATPGKVLFDDQVAQASVWTPTQVTITVPVLSAGIPHTPRIEVWSADGKLLAWQWTGLVVTPKVGP